MCCTMTVYYNREFIYVINYERTELYWNKYVYFEYQIIGRRWVCFATFWINPLKFYFKYFDNKCVFPKKKYYLVYSFQS